MATTAKTVNASADRIAVISEDGKLEQRIAAALPEAVAVAAEPPPDNSEAVPPAAVVATVSGSASSTAASIKRLRRRVGEVPLVVVIGTGRSHPEARAAISAGADGAVLETEIEATLGATVEAAESGQVAFPETLLRVPKHPSFTKREKQGMGMMVLGFTNQEIGNRLGLAETTIKSHLCSAFEKLGVSSRAEASALILDTADGIGLEMLAIEPDENDDDRT